MKYPPLYGGIFIIFCEFKTISAKLFAILTNYDTIDVRNYLEKSMKPIFRSSMFGFQKSDVVRFIAKQSEMHDSKVSELNEQIEKLRRDYDKEIEELTQDRVALEALQEDHLKKLDSILQIRRLTEEIRTGSAQLVSAADEGKQSVSEMCEEIVSLKSALEDAEKFRDKALKFDQLASVLTGIVNGEEVAVSKTSSQLDPVDLHVDLDAAKEMMEKQKKALLLLGEKLDLVLKLLESFAE